MHRVLESQPTGEFLETRARDLVRVAAALAAFCEHIEHNEPTLPQLPIDAARRLRFLAVDLAVEAGLDLASCYAERVQQVEKASLYSKVPSSTSLSLPGAEAMNASATWADFQVAQVIHDRQFHPDVFGLSKIDQLRHYTFHVMKLAGLLMDAIDSDSWCDFAPERLADLAIFGVKIATACNDRLPLAELSLR
jgi:hypothetical protein